MSKTVHMSLNGKGCKIVPLKQTNEQTNKQMLAILLTFVLGNRVLNSDLCASDHGCTIQGISTNTLINTHRLTLCMYVLCMYTVNVYSVRPLNLAMPDWEYLGWYIYYLSSTYAKRRESIINAVSSFRTVQC